MERSLTILKRSIGSTELVQIRELIETEGDGGRSYISKHLCRMWDWRLPNGQLRDIACRDLLRRLEKRGLIQLPPPLRASRRVGYKNTTSLPKDFVSTPLSQSLGDFSVIEIEMVRGSGQERLYNALIDSLHYLGYHQGTGEQLKYIIRGDGHVLSAIGFGGAAFKSEDRDQHIGWDKDARERHLVKVVNNNRFLILPWIRVPHLASHILGRISRRIRADWHDYYKRDIVLLETFVEQGRFKGTCYKAFNWRYIGQTTGRGRNDRYSNNLLAHVATEHYVNGIRLGHLERQTGVNVGSLIKAMHQLGGILKDVPDRLIKEYRQAPVKHADETGWRNDGQNGYGWLFGTKDIAIFRFRGSRSGKVAQDVFGKEQLPGVLVVNRYAGYNKAPCKIQYCYAHLLRDVQKLEKEFPDNKEIKTFIQAAAPQP